MSRQQDSSITRQAGAESERGGKLLLHVFPSFAAGGAQMRFVSLANHFGRAYRHAVIALDGDLGCRSRLSPDLALSFLPLPHGADNLVSRVLCYRRKLAELQPDVLVTSNWGAVEWAIANLRPIARHIHTEDGFGPEERDRQLRRRVLTRRLVLRRSIVAMPSHTLIRIARDVWRLPPGQLRYIPNGVDLGRFRPLRTRARSGPAVIGCVAALRPEKNLARLLRAVSLLGATRPFRLVIAGDGPERSALAATADELRLPIEFRGEIADPAPLYREFDVFALSSDTEQMPLSVLEAMASGLAVAATDVGDIAGMVAPENRPFISGRDDMALASSLGALLDAPERCHAIGAVNRRRTERDFDQMLMFQRYRNLLDGNPEESKAA
jgi:glycosyltransferase involved in cell wall biosynthesis